MKKTKAAILLAALLLCFSVCGCHPGGSYTWSDSLRLPLNGEDALQIPVKSLSFPAPSSAFGLDCGDGEFVAELLRLDRVLEVRTVVEPIDDRFGGVYGKTNGTYLVIISEDHPERNFCIFSKGRTVAGENQVYQYQPGFMKLTCQVEEEAYTVLFPVYLIAGIDELRFAVKPDTDYSLVDTVNAAEVITEFYRKSAQYQIEVMDETTLRILPESTAEPDSLNQPFEIIIRDGVLRLKIGS